MSKFRVLPLTFWQINIKNGWFEKHNKMPQSFYIYSNIYLIKIVFGIHSAIIKMQMDLNPSIKSFIDITVFFALIIVSCAPTGSRPLIKVELIIYHREGLAILEEAVSVTNRLEWNFFSTQGFLIQISIFSWKSFSLCYICIPFLVVNIISSVVSHCLRTMISNTFRK